MTFDHGSDNQDSNVNLESDSYIPEKSPENRPENSQENVGPEIEFSKQIVAASILSAEVFVSDEKNMKECRYGKEQLKTTRPETEPNVFKNTVYRSEVLRKAYRGCLQAVQEHLSPRNELRVERCKTRNPTTRQLQNWKCT